MVDDKTLQATMWNQIQIQIQIYLVFHKIHTDIETVS